MQKPSSNGHKPMTKVGIAAQEASNFMLEGPTGEVAYKQAEEIAGLIRHDNSAH